MEQKVIKDSLLGKYTYAVLDNSLKVFVMEKPEFSGTYAIFGTRYGSIDTKFSKNGEKEISVPEGIAHFLEHKLFESEDGDAFTKFAATGAYANAFTSFDRTCYLFSCSKNFEKNLDILLSFVQSPYFTEQTVNKEQGIIGQEIRMYLDSPPWRVLFNMLENMYEEHPVKIDIAGTEKSIAQIDVDLLYECYNTFYNPANMFVCIAGNVKTGEVLEKIEASIKPCEKIEITRGEFKETKRVKRNYVCQNLEVASPLFCLGYKEILDSNVATVKERIVADILLEVLCGECSPLYRKLTDKGLINDEFSSEYFVGNGYSCIMIDGESSSPETIREEIEKEINRLINEGIQAELFEAIKKSEYADAIKRFDSNESIVMGMVDCAINGSDLFEGVKVLKEITQKDVIDRLKTLNKESSVLSVILPQKES